MMASSYAGAARLANDPRLRDPDNGALTALTPHIAYDIRIDAPPFTFFDRVLDGAEFDEEVHSDKLVIGETNLINVQVHNTGLTRRTGVGPSERCLRSPLFRRRNRGQRAGSRCRFLGDISGATRGRRDLAEGREVRRWTPSGRRSRASRASNGCRRSRSAIA